MMTDPLEPGALVAFDFDGTLTHRDSFTAFLAWRAGARRWLWGLVKLVPAMAGYAFNRDRGLLKGRFVRECHRKASPRSGDGGAGGNRYSLR